MLNKVIGSAFWNVAATLSQLMLQLVVLATLGRLLIPEDFGLVGIATVVSALASLLGQLGIGQALIQRSSVGDRLVRSGFTISLVAGLSAATLMAVLSGSLASVFREPDAAPFIKFVALSVLARSLGTVADSLLQREMRFREVGLITVGSYVLGYLALAVPLAASGFGAWSLAIAVVAQAVSKAALSLVFRPHSVIPMVDLDSFKRLLSFGGRVTLSRLLSTLALQGDNLLIARTLGPVALGLYNRSYQLMLIPVQLIGQTLSSVLYPALSQMKHRTTALREAYLTAASFSTLLGGIASALFVPMAPEIVRLVLGSGWDDAVLPLQLLSAVIMQRVAYKLDDTLAKATGTLNARLIRDVVYALAIVIGVWLGVRWNLVGAAVAVGGAITLNYVLGLTMSLRIIQASLRDYLSCVRSTFVLVPLAFVGTIGLRTMLVERTGSAILVIMFVTLGVTVMLFALVVAFPTTLTEQQRKLVSNGLRRFTERGLVNSLVKRLS